MGYNPDTAIFYEVVSLSYILFSFEEYKLTDGGLGNICKANIRVGEIQQFCRLQDEGRSLMRAVMTQLNLSARAYHRILKLSRTIADLARGEGIQSAHLAEALHASQSSKDHDRVIILIELNWIILNGEA